MKKNIYETFGRPPTFKEKKEENILFFIFGESRRKIFDKYLSFSLTKEEENNLFISEGAGASLS